MTGNSPYTAVRGTFTVPALVSGTPENEVVGEWVGVDGLNVGGDGDDNLIQAGVSESMAPCSGTSLDTSWPYDPDRFYICPWTFLVMNGQDQEGPIPDLTISTGDSVSVEIWQVAGSEWGVELTDETTGQTWENTVGYTGPGLSAEWIVEDPGLSGQGCGGIGQCPMPEYTPPVRFSDIGMTPNTYANLYSETLVQNGNAISTPSPLSSNFDFSVSYTGPTTVASGMRKFNCKLLPTGHSLGTPFRAVNANDHDTPMPHPGPARLSAPSVT